MYPVLAADAREHLGEVKFVIGRVCSINQVRGGNVLVQLGDSHQTNFAAVFTRKAYADVLEEHGGIKLGDYISVYGEIDFYGNCPHMTIDMAANVRTETDASEIDEGGSSP